jgi:hypothetical protein
MGTALYGSTAITHRIGGFDSRRQQLPSGKLLSPTGADDEKQEENRLQSV